ncbi:MAG: alpha/beta fold hydrolase [Burkholderiaceae bacterium]|nr:alpha/beta fold hydrolase [Burkholderiaceae bacterium]
MDLRMEPRTELYPAIEPYDAGMLPLDGIHTMYWEVSGNPRVVLFDQRGAGCSTPLGETTHNTLSHLIADIETLREYLGVERWLVFGGSWGSTLGLAYGQKHPERVRGFVLRGIFLGRQSEIDWFLFGLRHVFPEAWRKFVEMLPPDERADPLRGYARRLFDADPRVHLPFARAWSEYEASCSTLLPNPELVRHFSDDAIGLARLEAHYFLHRCFLAPDQLLNELYRVRQLPAAIVQARYDMVCPIASADALARAWPGARYVVVPDAGHSVWEPPVRSAVMREVELMKARFTDR